jgi:H+/Cl- antiporter ClcA
MLPQGVAFIRTTKKTDLLNLPAHATVLRTSDVRMTCVVKMLDARPVHQKEHLAALVAVTVLSGIGAGLGGMSLVLLLHFIQHVAYGYSVNALIGQESFLQGVTSSSPMRRVLALAACGLITGVGWWIIYRFGRPLVSIRKAVRADDPRMPVVATTAHALLQIIAAALGSPLGREVAPREIGATFAGWLSWRTGLPPATSRILVACGAGAGLAAVYNVPLAGALFVLEVLLRSFRLSTFILAITTSVTAAAVAGIALGNGSQYTVPHLTISLSLVIWSIVAGPVLGFAAYWYARLAAASRSHAPRDWRLLVWCLISFLVIGVVAIPFPQLLGNGRGPTQMAFDSNLTIGLAATTLLLKIPAVAGSLRAGAEGGLLTPSLTIGALLATLIGYVWNLSWPGVPLGDFAIVGAAAFLASAMEMPVTAIALIVELTRADQASLIPIFLAVAGSVAASRLSSALRSKSRISAHALHVEMKTLRKWASHYSAGVMRSKGAIHFSHR